MNPVNKIACVMTLIGICSVSPHHILYTHGFNMILITPRPNFTRPDGTKVMVDSLAWILGNWGSETPGGKVQCLLGWTRPVTQSQNVEKKRSTT